MRCTDRGGCPGSAAEHCWPSSVYGFPGSGWRRARRPAPASKANRDSSHPRLAEHPAGALFVFANECHSGLERWSATIDGMPVALVGSGIDDGLELVTLASTPTEGAEVVLTHACGEDTDEADCIDGYLDRFTTTIGPADVAPPPPIAALTVDHEVGMLADECGDPEVHALRIDATLEIGDRPRAKDTFCRRCPWAKDISLVETIGADRPTHAHARASATIADAKI